MDLTNISTIAVLKIILIDVLLSGDNAIVIAMATLKLNPVNRRRGIIIGTSGAILLRIILTSAAAFIFSIPLVQFLSGILLIWITIKLLVDFAAREARDVSLDSPTRLRNAIKIIIIADFSMSMDNILAVSGASHGNPVLLVFGLLVSIPILMFFSQKIVGFMDRFPVLVYGGALMLCTVAGEIIVSDRVAARYIHEPLDLLVTVLIVMFVFAVSKIKIYFIS